MPYFEKYDLVEITPEKHDVVLDIRYATENNFTGLPVYKSNICLLHRDAELALCKSVEIAKKLGFKIKIFDAFRPQEVQEVLWEHTPDPEFLADPIKGSPHSRGVALDLTLISFSGEELDMGTKFDEFTALSHHGVIEGISERAIENRIILMGIMTTAGWDFYRNEWWHYQLFNAREKYPLIHDKEARTGLT